MRFLILACVLTVVWMNYEVFRLILPEASRAYREAIRWGAVLAAASAVLVALCGGY